MIRSLRFDCVCVFLSFILCMPIKYELYTGRLILYSEITKIYYSKTVGHVFAKPVQIEGTAKKKKIPVSCFHPSSHFCR